MNRRFESFTTIAVAALAYFAMGASNVPAIAVPKDGATIFNPGNGDYLGFRIVIEPSGQAVAVDGAGHASALLRDELVRPFFDDLSTAMPATVSAQTCAQGHGLSSTTVEVNAAVDITWNGHRWGRLDCSDDPRAERLLQDAMAIRSALYVQAYRERTIVVWLGASDTNVTAFTPGGLPQAGGDFNAGAFRCDAFSTYNFNTAAFSAGDSTRSSPFNGSLVGTTPTGSLPGSTTVTGFPPSSITFTNPMRGAPANSFSTTSPYNGQPYNGSPYSGGP